MKQLNLLTADGHKVYYNNKHLKVLGDATEYLEEAIRNIDSRNERIVKVCVEFGKIIGVKTCVNIRKGDSFRYATRLGCKYPTRFVLNREPEPCSTIVVIMKKTPNSKNYGYALKTAYIGDFATKEVHDPTLTYKEAHEANEFWSNHALIWGHFILETEQ